MHCKDFLTSLHYNLPQNAQSHFTMLPTIPKHYAVKCIGVCKEHSVHSGPCQLVEFTDQLYALAALPLGKMLLEPYG
jgi:hypothetical protein